MDHSPTKIAVVIGHPISHSRSPTIHNYWLNFHCINAHYQPLDIPINDLPQFVADLRAKKYIGANVTLPHKQNVYSQCDLLTSSAQSIGAVNTMYLESNQLVGDNTDAYGFLSNLDQLLPQWDSQLKQVIVLGAGGAARAILHALISRKAGEIIVLNRTQSNAQKLVDWFADKKGHSNLTASDISSFPIYAPKTNFLVNTSSVGLNNTRFDNLNLAHLPPHALVHDIVYTPLLTPLLADAQNLGLKTADGLGMLLHQATPGFEKWFGIKPTVDENLRQIVLETL